MLTLAGVAPLDVMTAAGQDWSAGMAPENLQEFDVARQGEAPMRAWLTELRPHFVDVTGEHIVDSLGALVDAPDKAVLTGEFAEHMAGVVPRGAARRRRRVARRRPRLPARLGFRARGRGDAGVVVAGRAGPDGAVRARAVPGRSGWPTSAATCCPTTGTCRYRSAGWTRCSPTCDAMFAQPAG